MSNVKNLDNGINILSSQIFRSNFVIVDTPVAASKNFPRKSCRGPRTSGFPLSATSLVP
jgi:hypothetical protein